ncbi:ABC transporter permease [Nonomuraea sp. NPDC049421]|uniref:ABC transporter permease n=1 Tax=Nonomuraea sp. NPDC049421 TaxID=3155275 RepID=UPI0034331B14
MSSLVAAHTRILLLEQLRVPIGLAAGALFPAVALAAFVVPFAGDDPRAATMATASLTLFGAMSQAIIGLSVTVAQDREQPWNPYIRTLPAGPFPRFAGRILAMLAQMVLAVVPVLVVAALFTAATITPLGLLAGLVTLLAGVVPFMLMGLFIGFLLTAKATIAVSQLLFFPMGVLGGLLLPPQILPGFLEAVSPFTPARGVAELLWAVTAGTTPGVVSLVSLAAWTVLAAAGAVWAYRRDEGRRFA